MKKLTTKAIQMFLDGKMTVEEFCPEPVLIIKEANLLNCPHDLLNLPNTVLGWDWLIYSTPEQFIKVDGHIGLALKRKLGFVEIATQKDGTVCYGDAEESFLKKYEGYFGIRDKERKAGMKKYRPSGLAYRRSMQVF